MKAILLTTLLLFVGNFCISQTESGDTTKKTLKIITKFDGTVYIGVILSDDGREILIDTESLGKIYISKKSIRSITNVGDDEVNEVGMYEPEGPFTTRYYFTTNALPLKKGEDYAMVHLYGPEVHFSLGGGFSIGAMTTWFVSPFILAMKKSFKTKKEKINFSIVTLIGSSGYLNAFSGYGGLGFATFTYGTPANNVSVSLGYGFFNPGRNAFLGNTHVTASDGFYPSSQFSNTDLTKDGAITKHSPVFQFAGIKKIKPKVSFIFDSMFSLAYPSKKTIESGFSPTSGESGFTVSTSQELTTLFFIMPGMRFQKSPKNAFQIALAGCTYIRGGNTVAFPLPQCSWFFKF